MKPQNNIVEYTLEASEFNWEIKPGKTIAAWGFNNQVPGPLLKAKQGDTLVVKVVNNLPEPTLIHWHGIRLPATMDGTGEVQQPIQPGEHFEYRFEVPDAGTFWYHSHQNETVQMERGMYGGIVVAADNDPIVDNDRLFMIDDMKLTNENAFKKHGAIGRWIERHDGREGSTCLLNGKEAAILHMNAGQVERWRFVNAASARYFLLSLGGKPFRMIATDGGLLEKARTETELLITPGERFDIVVGPFEEGTIINIETLPYNRTTFLKAKKQQYATIHVTAEKPSKAFIPEQLNWIESLAPQDAIANRQVKMSVAPSLKRGIDFLVNDEMHCNDEPVMVGDLQVWEVSNTSMMDHPFHLHGFFFQVLEENGKVPAYKAWKDTYNLKPKSTIKIAWMPDNRPGRWMYHCHILEHHAAGMMAHFEVVDPNSPAAPKQKPVHSCQLKQFPHHKTK
ncbi:multicopper oxidase family protein [Ilyomonas limi]|uniref:Multicopper oxidase family protein n=1 Tax=Ilyomonas limi TaxID=2575867 RepID=A0A4U3L9L7_9BACT|nr:multicopper oxidase family protein [Ilyomonas limi]TKK71998.1 multicopper oxidase family protein [Ilyomonas limi]